MGKIIKRLVITKPIIILIVRGRCFSKRYRDNLEPIKIPKISKIKYRVRGIKNSRLVSERLARPEIPGNIVKKPSRDPHKEKINKKVIVNLG